MRPHRHFSPIYIGTAAFLALVACTLTPGHTAPRQIKVTSATAGEVTILAPNEEPKAFILFISDRDGLTEVRRREAERFVTQGAAVALIDLPDFMKRTAESSDKDCHYPFGVFEDVSHVAERELGMTAWRWPVMIGIGEGGTLAFLAAAQAPENTAAGGISIGMQPSFSSKLTMCGVEEQKTNDGTRTYEPPKKINGNWTLIATEQPPPEIAAFTTSAPTAKLLIVKGDLDAELDAALQEAFEIGGAPKDTLAGIPVVELPAKGKISGLAVFISGDGGWRDIDKQIAEYLSERGIGIVGIDSLRYFWRRKVPRQIADDVAKVIAHYTKLWQVRKVSLLGYSLGANVIPFAWNNFDKATQNVIQVLVFLGLEPTTAFEITVQGWLGMATSTELDVRPQLVSLPVSRVMCFYGTAENDEHDTACVLPELRGAQIVQRPGGHHFDGDYRAVAQMIFDRITGKAAG